MSLQVLALIGKVHMLTRRIANALPLCTKTASSRQLLHRRIPEDAQKLGVTVDVYKKGGLPQA